MCNKPTVDWLKFVNSCWLIYIILSSAHFVEANYVPAAFARNSEVRVGKLKHANCRHNNVSHVFSGCGWGVNAGIHVSCMLHCRARAPRSTHHRVGSTKPFPNPTSQFHLFSFWLGTMVYLTLIRTKEKHKKCEINACSNSPKQQVADKRPGFLCSCACVLMNHSFALGARIAQPDNLASSCLPRIWRGPSGQAICLLSKFRMHIHYRICILDKFDTWLSLI